MKLVSKVIMLQLIMAFTALGLGMIINTATYAADAPAMTEEQKTLHAIGVSIYRSLTVFNLSPSEFEYVKQGMIDAQTGKKTDEELNSYNSKIQELAKARRKASGEKQFAAGKEFLEKAAVEKGAVKTASGMVYNSLVSGKGDSPKATDIVKVNYKGTLAEGREFDNSYRRGKPLEFKLDNVIKCWVEGIQMMKPGGKAKLVCPPNLAYGDNGAGELILPGATLAFEVELVDFKKPEINVKPVNTVPAKPEEPAKK